MSVRKFAVEAPTPWTVDSDEALKIRDAEGCTVATIAQITLRRRRHTEETHAIAALLAAAPALLVALNSLTRYAEWQIAEGGSYHPTLPSAVSAAREATARALGRYDTPSRRQCCD